MIVWELIKAVAWLTTLGFGMILVYDSVGSELHRVQGVHNSLLFGVSLIITGLYATPQMNRTKNQRR